MLSTHRVLVWDRGADERYRLYACLRRTDRRLLVRGGAAQGAAPTVRATVTGGRVAIAATEVTSSTGGEVTTIYRANLRARRVGQGVLFYNAQMFDTQSSLTALAVDSKWHVGLITTVRSSEGLPFTPPFQRVTVDFPSGKQRVVAESERIDPSQLSIRSGRIRWREDGATREAPVGQPAR